MIDEGILLVRFLARLACLAAMVNSVTFAESPSTFILTGRIWTGNPRQLWAEAIGIEGEQIVAVGEESDVSSKLGRDVRKIDAGEGLIVPGMCDSHIHLIEGGRHLASVQLRHAKSKEEFASLIAKFIKTKRPPGKQWLTGGDWDHTLWGGELPDRNWIDEVTGGIPVWLSRLDGHMALANTAAMNAAGITDDVEEIEGGEIVRDATGRLTGLFKDNAMSLIQRAQPSDTLEQRLESAVAGMKYLAEHGVTAVHHMGSRDDLTVLRLAQQRGLLTARIYAFTPLGQWQRLADEVNSQGRGDSWLKIGGLKGFVDGSLGSHTAAFLEPFTDQPASRGLLVTTEDELEAWTQGADAAGLQVAVHAIGDRANRIQLDIFERVAAKNGPRDRRFRIEHAQHIHPNDLARFGKLQVIASMQPYHAIDDGRWAEGVIGQQRCETTYPFRSLLDTKARLAFGSDWFVAPAEPLVGIDAAVTRRTLDGKNSTGWIPAQKIAAQEALRAYTSDAAYAGFAEKELGTLEVGKLADLVIIDRNILDPAASEIGQAKVVLTMVGGRIVLDRR